MVAYKTSLNKGKQVKIKILFLVTFFITTLMGNQNPYIITHDDLIDPRAQDKILEIGNEVKEKLGVHLYINLQENNGIDRKLERKTRLEMMKNIELNLVKNLQKPYAVLSIAVDQTYANILMSDELKTVIDKDDILDGYVIPLLASKDKNTLFAKASAACLNGFAQIGDSVAKAKNIKLDSSIGSEGKVAGTIWKMFMYTLVLGGIILYAIILLRERKYKKEAQK